MSRRRSGSHRRRVSRSTGAVRHVPDDYQIRRHICSVRNGRVSVFCRWLESGEENVKKGGIMRGRFIPAVRRRRKWSPVCVMGRVIDPAELLKHI